MNEDAMVDLYWESLCEVPEWTEPAFDEAFDDYMDGEFW